MEKYQRKLTLLVENVIRASIAAFVALYTEGRTKIFEAIEPMLTTQQPYGILPTLTTSYIMYIMPKTLIANSHPSCSSLTPRQVYYV